jgi:23S rRNA pseudouridine2604 synthase
MDLYPMRINKVMALRGLSTRKDADILIERGLVSVNGKKAVLGQKVNEADVIKVGGKQKTYRYYAFNKPLGVITHSPQHGEDDVAESAGIPGVFPVGRLDKRSHGLIILTDDARVTDKLLNPKYDHDKEYRVKTKSKLASNFKNRMERGVNIEGYMTKECTVDVTGERTFLVTLTEGKKHQIRRMCAALGVDIADLERIRVMNIKLDQLKPGAHREIKGPELSAFLRSLELVA